MGERGRKRWEYILKEVRKREWKSESALGRLRLGGWVWPLGQMPVERYPCAVSQHTRLTHPHTLFSSGVNGQLAFCAKHHGVPLISVIDSEKEPAPHAALSQRGRRGWRKSFKILGTAKTPGNPWTLTGESSFRKTERKRNKAKHTNVTFWCFPHFGRDARNCSPKGALYQMNLGRFSDFLGESPPKNLMKLIPSNNPILKNREALVLV